MQALLGLRVTTLDMLGRLERDLRGMERDEEADAWKARGSLRASKKRYVSKYPEKDVLEI